MLKKRHVAPKIRANGGAELIAIKSRNLEPSKNPSVTLFYFNAWSIFHKMDTIKLAINEISPSFVCVSESWLTQSIPTAAVEIRDFIVYRSDSTSVNPSGGVLLYGHKSITTSELKLPTELEAPEGVEFICINAQVSKLKSFIVCAIYNHPPINLKILNYNFKLLMHLASLQKTVHIIGDFNINVANKEHNITKKFLTKIEQLNLKQLVSEATRVSENSSTTIDLFITNDEEKVQSVKCMDRFVISDHRSILVKFNIKPPITKTRQIEYFRKLNKYSPEALQCTLANNFIDMACNSDNILLCADNFTQNFLNCLDIVAPTASKIKKAGFHIKLSKEAVNAQDIKSKFYKKACKSKNSEDWAAYRTESKKAASILYTERRNAIHEKLKRNRKNGKILWKTLKNIAPMKSNDSLFNDEQITAENSNFFNDYYTSVGEKTFQLIESCNPPKFELNDHFENLPEFEFKHVEISDVHKIVMRLKNSNSETPDGLTIKFIKDSFPVTGLVITQLINLSITTNRIPDSWKTALVTPIPKGNNNLVPDKSRPISIQPPLGKILENVFVKQLMTHLESNRILNRNQFAYRKKSSTSLAISVVSNKLYNNFEQRKLSLLILLDLSKAFDSIPHYLLIRTLNHYNIKLPWVADYLTNRTQRTKIGHIKSDPRELNFGVPQGSVLGPILFIIYINGISKFEEKYHDPDIELNILSYADDTQILLSSSPENYDRLIEFSEMLVEDIVLWFRMLRLLINLSKTQAILFCTPKQFSKIPVQKRKISIMNEEIKFAENVKNLGVFFDRHFNFKFHTQKLFAKVFGILNYINKQRSLMTLSTRKMLVEQCALVNLNYCTTAWVSINQADFDTLQKLISFGAKVVFCKQKYDHSSHLIRQLQWMPMRNKAQYFLAIDTYKTVHGLYNPNVTQIFSFRYYENSGTRSKNRIIIPRNQTSYGDKSIYNRAANFWSSLDDKIKLGSFTSFAKHMRDMLLVNGQGE